MTRCTSVDVTFAHPFSLPGVEGTVPAGTYRIDTDEEPIDGLSFLAWRRLATFIRIPVRRSGTVESFLIDPKSLAAAVARDGAATAALTPPPDEPPAGP
jgi:hypothetical protein